VRSEIERELAAEDLKRTINETRQAADVRADVKAAGADIEVGVRAAASTSSPAAAPPDERH